MGWKFILSEKCFSLRQVCGKDSLILLHLFCVLESFFFFLMYFPLNCNPVYLCILTCTLLFHKLDLPEKYHVFYKNKKLCLLREFSMQLCACVWFGQAKTILIKVNRRLRAGTQYLVIFLLIVEVVFLTCCRSCQKTPSKKQNPCSIDGTTFLVCKLGIYLWIFTFHTLTETSLLLCCFKG